MYGKLLQSTGHPRVLHSVLEWILSVLHCIRVGNKAVFSKSFPENLFESIVTLDGLALAVRCTFHHFGIVSLSAHWEASGDALFEKLLGHVSLRHRLLVGRGGETLVLRILIHLFPIVRHLLAKTLLL